MAKSFSSLEFLKLHKPEWKYLFIGFIGCIGVGLRWTAVGFFSGQLIPLFSLTEDDLTKAATSFNIFFVVLAVLSAILSYMQDKGMTEASKRLIARTRLLVFENLLRQPTAWFDQETSSPGILVNRLARTAPLIEAASGLRVARVIAASATLFSGFLIAFLYSWKLTSVMFLCTLVMAGVAYMQQRVQMKHQLRDANLFDTAGRVALETVRNIRTVKALGQETLFTEIYMKHLELPYKEARKQAFQSSILNAAACSITPFMLAVVLEVGGYLFTSGEIQLDDISKVYFSIVFSSVMLMFVISYLQDNMKARTAMKLLNYLLTRKSQLDETALTGYKEEIKGNVEFKDVHFSYPTRPDVKVLNGISFTIEAGKTLALVGESGSGKSTVISLLERYYDADSGMIQIDGYDIKALNVFHLRSNVGLITQEPVLFNLTIKDNITYGTASKQTSITFDDIQEAAKIANAHELVMALPHRYDTIAGERGVQLSGGEKQRLAIARALIRNPKILLMDEATSALDSKSEQMVQAALNNAKQGRTCIIVAHRLSTIQDVDKICVISKGRIVENGTHEELQKLKGHYYNLIKKHLS